MSAAVIVTIKLPTEGEQVGFIGDQLNATEAEAPSYEQVAAALQWLAGHFDSTGSRNELRDQQDKVTLTYSDLRPSNIEAMGVKVSWEVIL